MTRQHSRRGYGVFMARTGWLDEREQRAWRGFVRLHAEVLGRLNRHLVRETALSAPDYEVLVHLSEAPDGQLRMFELGRAMQWEKSRLSHHLRRMMSRGLVDRGDCSTDARGVFVAITDAGRDAIGAAAPKHVAEVRRVFVDALSNDQLDQLADIADTVIATLAPEEGCEQPEEPAH